MILLTLHVTDVTFVGVGDRKMPGLITNANYMGRNIIYISIENA